ncbi:XdhC family protein [Niallia oryzisoli]|uniref:XdhC family protein n=1 Tax=Niallia oryzisoli TaxID=1737571 RepID=A0ABZ2CC63_9BACI
MGKQSPFEAWLASVQEEQECVLATILPINQPFADNEPCRLFISQEYKCIGDLQDEELNLRVSELARRKLTESNPKSETRVFTMPEGKEIHVFIDVYIPPVELLIFGAGHDAIPVAKYAVSLGFNTSVIDQRDAYNNEERFPGTNQILAKPDEFVEKVKISSRTYIVVMNHHIEKDQETLKFVLPSPAAYVGVLGPRSRRMRMLQALEDEGVTFAPEMLKRMHSPIGLDIGAVTPEEIAMSILAEMIALKNGHTGGFLKGSDTIHQPAGVKEKEHV